MESSFLVVQMMAAAVFLGAVLYGGLSDLCRFRIPNWTSAVALLAFLPQAVAAGWDGAAILPHLGAGLAVLGVGLVMFAVGIAGGGDVKLLAAAAVWFGWRNLLPFVFVVAVAGGVLALALLAFRRLRLPRALASIAWVKRLHSEEKGVPYGVAIAAGAVALLPTLPVGAAAPGG